MHWMSSIQTNVTHLIQFELKSIVHNLTDEYTIVI